MPDRLPEAEYGEHETVRSVPTTKDYISFKARHWIVPRAFRGERVAIRPLDDRFHETDHGTGYFLADSSFVFDRTRSCIMAGWRQAVELVMTDEEIGSLVSIARSRTEAASRVARAQMLLAYGEKLSFAAVGQRLGVHHQTVQRCIERALAYGPLAALDDRPRPGKEPTITPEAKAWLVSLACDKAKEHGYPHELGRRGCWRVMRASMDREPDTNVSPAWFRARCAKSLVRKKSSRTRCAIIWNVAMPNSRRRWRKFCVSIARSKS